MCPSSISFASAHFEPASAVGVGHAFVCKLVQMREHAFLRHWHQRRLQRGIDRRGDRGDVGSTGVERIDHLRWAGSFLGNVSPERIEQLGEDPLGLARDFALPPGFAKLRG